MFAMNTAVSPFPSSNKKFVVKDKMRKFSPRPSSFNEAVLNMFLSKVNCVYQL